MNLIDTTIAFVKTTLKNAEGGHDWFHIERVYKTALTIAKKEGNCNLEIVALGALLHDIADSKFYNGDETIGPKVASAFLEKENAGADVIDAVVKIIENISYKGGVKASYSSAELNIVQDADRLDALGAIGIARTFNYGGFKNRALYDPNIDPKPNQTKEEYKNSTAPTINHFYEKLLLLKGKMNTKTGKQMAEERHIFMEQFLAQFYKEWEGEI